MSHDYYYFRTRSVVNKVHPPGRAVMMAQQVKDYENYSATSLHYDECRQAVGIEIILGALSVATTKSLKDIHILDAGCGTGNYLVAVSDFVGKVTGVEINEGMLVQAKKKTAHLANVDVHHGNILSLSFPDQQFDGVLCNQVLHHLEPKGCSGFNNTAQCFREVYRVLKPKGTLIINTCTPEQCATGYWFYQLNSEIFRKELCPRHPSQAEFQRLMQESGFRIGPALSLTSETHVKPEVLYDKEGPFRQEWRSGDSSWAVLKPEELKRTLDTWRKTIDEGKADDFIKSCEEHRMQIGSTMSIVGYKRTSENE